MRPDEHADKINNKAEELGLNYRLGTLIVALKDNRGTICKATSFECSHVKGNFEMYDKEKHGVLNF